MGYGPNHHECIHEMQHADVCILGNHDEAVIACPDPDEFGPSALQAVKWTRDQLQDEDTKNVSSLRRYYQEHSLLLVHGSPKDPTNEYVLPMESHNSIKMAALFDRFDQCPLQGHTHIPGVFNRSQFLRLHELDQRQTLRKIDVRPLFSPKLCLPHGPEFGGSKKNYFDCS